MVELELPGKNWTALNKVLAPRGKKSQVHWNFLPLLILKQDLSFSIENCKRWLTGWQNVGMRWVMVQMANQHLIARRQISSGHDKSAGASRSSSEYFQIIVQIFLCTWQNIPRSSSEYFQSIVRIFPDRRWLDLDWFLNCGQLASQQMLKIWGKPLWNVRCQHHIQRHHCHLCLCTNNFNNYLQRRPPPIFYQKVTQQISNFTAVVFLGRKALPALLLLDCEDVGKYQSTRKTIFECLFGCRKLLEPIV